jgi:hypothetical protein
LALPFPTPPLPLKSPKKTKGQAHIFVLFKTLAITLDALGVHFCWCSHLWMIDFFVTGKPQYNEFEGTKVLFFIAGILLLLQLFTI